MALPRWIPMVVEQEGERLLWSAKDVRQRYEHEPDQQVRNVMFGVADRWEQQGNELVTTVRTGTEGDIERAYHRIVPGPAATVFQAS